MYIYILHIFLISIIYTW